MTGTQLGAIARRVRYDLGQTHRYAHVLRVARMAGRLAARHGGDRGRAVLAGLLHDLARLYSAERLLAECAERGMPIDDFERANPIVLHARLGAELAREHYAIGDPEILDAIARHTVGAERMTLLDTVVYLADALEPGRTYPERAELARVAEIDLGDALRRVIASSIAYLENRGERVAPQTISLYRRLLAEPAASV